MALLNIKDEVLQRVYMVTFVMVAVALTVYFKAVKLVTTEGKYWRQQAITKNVAFKQVLGERGNILSEDGSLLATSLPYFDLYLDCTIPTEVDYTTNLDSLAWCMSYYVDNQYTPAAYKQFLWDQRMLYKNKYLPIKKGATYAETELIKSFPLLRMGRFKGGLIALKGSRREHPYKILAQRTLGYIREGAKPIGIEGSFDKVLSGNAGKQLMQRVGNDVWIPVNDLSEIEPKNGDDVVTTLDVNVQDVAQQALIRSLEYHQADHGCAIVMEVKTGKIKALANIGKTKEGWWETYNYGVGSAIEPGSTFKLASIMSLLEDGYVKLSDTVNIEGGKTKFYDEELVDAERTNITLTTVKKAFALSSNVGMAKITNEHYADKPAAFVKHLKDFNLNIPTGIEIEGEAPPYIKDPTKKEDKWSGTTVPWMAIGYELQITPLQLLTFYNAVANNGVMMKPYLISEYQRYGETVKKFQPTVIKKKIASDATIEQAHELLEAVVEYGTASKLKTDQYKFAGKTGTAQLDYEKLKDDKGAEIGGYQASFVGYFPADNPVYSCIVVISYPKVNGFYGGTVAGPVFREIADKCFASNIQLSEPINAKGKPVLTANLLPGDVGYKGDLMKAMQSVGLKYQEHTKDDVWTFLKAKGDTLHIIPRQMMKKDMIPSVVGMGLKDALFVLENRGLRVNVSGFGKVVAQSINPGTQTNGQSIYIKLE